MRNALYKQKMREREREREDLVLSKEEARNDSSLWWWKVEEEKWERERERLSLQGHERDVQGLLGRWLLWFRRPRCIWSFHRDVISLNVSSMVVLYYLDAIVIGTFDAPTLGSLSPPPSATTRLDCSADDHHRRGRHSWLRLPRWRRRSGVEKWATTTSPRRSWRKGHD